ncbi:MAG: DUF938 domain-containing protein [Gammaproteobacteria bacterium]|nr:DUF938 domain-containing protein [Gammaproteobacteria bacterium]
MNSILHAPAAERNREPILNVLQGALPARGRVLEIASGTGQHVVYFAAALPALHWIPSDPDPAQRASIAARTAAAGLDNVTEPLDLDVLGDWPDLAVDAVITANLLHVSARQTMSALCRGAAEVLAPGGLLQVYGPFKRDGEHTSAGNRQFDLSLKRQNSAWGIRDVEELLAEANDTGLALADIIEMPANNLCIVLRTRSGDLQPPFSQTET